MKNIILLLSLLFAIPLILKPQVNIDSALSVYCPFNGNSYDLSGNNNHAEVVGAELSTDRFGQSNSSYQLIGDGDYIRFYDLQHLFEPSWSYSVWIKLDALPSALDDAFLLSCPEIAHGEDVHLYVDNDNMVKAFLNVNDEKVSTGFTVQQNEWFHVLLSYSDADLNIYINGNLKATTATRYTDAYSSGDIIISSFYGGDQLKGRVFGSVDDVRFYQRALTMHEVEALYTMENQVSDVCYTTTVSHTICQGESYYVGGEMHAEPGVFIDSLTSVDGCDSIIITQLEVEPNFSNSYHVTICGNESYFAGGENQTHSGTFTDSLKTLNGCDSVITTYLTVNESYENIADVEICKGEVFYYHGGYQTLPGTYIDSNLNQFGCDSILITNLSVHPTYQLTMDTAIVEGESFFAEGEWQTESGIYIDSLLTTKGCDSVITSNLTVGPFTDQLDDSPDKNDGTTLYPNPVTHVLNIDGKGIQGDAQVKVFSEQGNMVLFKKVCFHGGSPIGINVNTLNNGCYFVQIVSKQKVINRTIVKHCR